MADSQVLKKIADLLNEEKWTRATISTYSIAQFKELDEDIRVAAEERQIDELRTICEEHLSHTKTSIIALFVDNKRWNLVEFLCERILEYGEDKNALRTLANCYKNDNREADVWLVYERLIKVDYDEADIVKLIAEKKEADGEAEAAVDYYKKAIHRYINKKLFTNVKEIWSKLVEISPQDIDFFFHVQKKIAAQISSDKAALLLQDLFKYYKDQKDVDVCLSILKLIIQYDEKDPLVRREITDCYIEKYKNHSRLDECVKLSSLASGPRNVFEAIADFEKHIAFDSGNFVHHRTWGVGRIASVEGDDITIDFAKSRGHKMSLKMAISSLQSLEKDHIWVLKAIWKKEKLHDKVKSDIPWTLRTIIRSFNNRTDLKHIKAELVPSILTVSEWNSWSTQARAVLKNSPLFGNTPDNIDTFVVRDRPISAEEKIFNQFKAEKNFYDRVQLMRDFFENADIDSEYFNEMFSFFTGYLKSYSSVNDSVVASFLLLKELSAKYSHLSYTLPVTFADLFAEIDSIETVFSCLKDADIRKQFLVSIRNFIPEWADLYVKLFPYSLSITMIHVLLDSGYRDKVKGMAIRIIENYRDNREAFLWLIKNAEHEDWFASLNLPLEKIIITLIHMLDITYKEIENHRDTTQNRKINRQIQITLFKEEMVLAYIASGEKDMVLRVVSLLDEVKDLDPGIKMQLKKKAIERFPDFRFNATEEKAAVIRGLFVTAAKYEEKQALLKNILEVEVPANSKEIGFAISLGDLRENAEYKAAKEKQELLNSTVAKLKSEIERATIFDVNTLNLSKISFATKVSLKNETSGQTEEYTILGPWESDPDKNVISYLSPFGNQLLGKKVGENTKFNINGTDYSYTVLSITSADLS
jgi:transcription elongation factor GreA